MKMHIEGTGYKASLTMPDGSIAVASKQDAYSYDLDLESILRNIPTLTGMLMNAMNMAESIAQGKDTDVESFLKGFKGGETTKVPYRPSVSEMQNAWDTGVNARKKGAKRMTIAQFENAELFAQYNDGYDSVLDGLG